MGYGTRDKGRNDLRNRRDETNDNLSLKTLRAKSYGFRLVFPTHSILENFSRVLPRGTVTRERYRHPRICYQRGGTMKNTSRKSRRSWTKVRKIINGTRIGRWLRSSFELNFKTLNFPMLKADNLIIYVI